MAPTLILIKHSLVTVNSAIPRDIWHLSEDGRRRCAPLADALAPYHPAMLIASVEPKALETAQLVGERLGIPVSVADELHENDRRGLPVVPIAMFRRRVIMFFEQPDERIMGMESANEARARFETAITQLLAAHPEETIAVVAHGVVITLFVTAHNPAVEPFKFWQQLEQPSMAVLSRPDFRLQDTIAHIR